MGRPVISVIIPVRNGSSSLPALLTMLSQQTLESNLWEAILVDNGSTDQSAAICQSAGFPTLSATQFADSDWARNIGVGASRGELLVFCDADCVPVQDWLEQILKHYLREPRAILACAIRFAMPDRPTAAQIYDSLVFLQQAYAVASRAKGFTANLAMAKVTWQQLGGFPVGTLAGDSFICQKAAGKGYLINYNSEAVIYHPPRQFMALLGKSLRVGKARFYNGRRLGQDSISHHREGLRGLKLLPHLQLLNPRRLRHRLRRRMYRVSPVMELKIYFVGLCCLVTGLLGYWLAWLSRFQRKHSIN